MESQHDSSAFKAESEDIGIMIRLMAKSILLHFAVLPCHLRKLTLQTWQMPKFAFLNWT